MKYIRQFLLILVISFLGEVCNYLIPLPVPASIYGLFIFLTALILGVIRLEQVKETAVFLIEIMPFMFIPAGVGLINSWEELQKIFVPALVATLISTIFVMGISGKVTQFIMKKDKKD